MNESTAGSSALDKRPDTPPASITARLSFLDRWLAAWILVAMLIGLLLGRFVPRVPEVLSSVTIGEISVPIAIGLLVMMYPPLAKVKYGKLSDVTSDRHLMVVSLILNWLVGPALMFVLGWLLLPDLPEYRTGLIIVGLARCIAMVLIWNDLACGDREAAAVLVAVNSVFQVLMFAVLGWFYLQILPTLLGLSTASAAFSIGAIVLSVVVFLGIPLVAGALSRVIGERAMSPQWYEERFLPRISPLALWGLLFTIVLLFSLQGKQITTQPLAVLRIAIPLMIYFFIMFALALFSSRAVGLNYARSATVAFTAAGNNFELAIAVAVGTFGATSGQALAGTVGPLIEVPALVALVYVAMWLGPKLFPGDLSLPGGIDSSGVRSNTGTSSGSKAKKKNKHSDNDGAPKTAAALPAEPVDVLFVCTRNAGKSQMAEAITRRRVAEVHAEADNAFVSVPTLTVASAGTSTVAGKNLNAESIEACAEIGVDMSTGSIAQVTTEALAAAGRIIVIGSEAQLPPEFKQQVEHWDLDEPSHRGITGLERMRLVRDDISRRVEELLDREGIASH